MNDRIKELAERAGINMGMTEFTGCLKGQDYLVTDRNLSEFELEKFAELIVKECAMIAYDADADHGDKILEAFDMPYIEE